MELKQRSEIEARYQWRLEDIYPTDDAWEADFARAKTACEGMASAADALRPDAESVLETLRQAEALEMLVGRLYPYARMRRDEDSRRTGPQALADRAHSLAVEADAATSFLRPALLAMPESLLRACLADARFADYTRTLEAVLRMRPHTLPAAQEALLAQAGEVMDAPSTIYTLFTEADLKFDPIRGADGETLELTDARMPLYLRDRNADIRRAAYEGILRGYGRFGNTVAAAYAASVKGDWFAARARGFASSLEASLFYNEIPVSVYGALLDAVEGRLPALNRYIDVKRAALGLPEMHLWDLYVDAEKGFEMNLSYEEAYALVMRALAPLGEDYVSVLRGAEGWVDAMESEGKHHGAYSWGCYGVHPFVMMNFTGNLDSASTLAHELGHSMHSYYSGQAQPFAKSDYTLFCAEVASTVNEVLLTYHLLDTLPGKEARRSILGTLLEHFRTTVFRQSLFAAFERETHAMAERGEALTSEALSDAYEAINRRFYGAACVVDDAVRSEWMRIPHFYRAFYVYQYATGFSAAVCIARRILREGAPAVAGYRKFLASGGSLPPLEALRLAGVDMATPGPVDEALACFEESVEAYAALC